MLHKALLRVAGILGGGITGLASLQSKHGGEFAGLAKIPPSRAKKVLLPSLGRESGKRAIFLFAIFLY